MISMRRVTIFTILLSVYLCFHGLAQSREFDVWVEQVKVIEVETGEVRENQYVGIKEDLITYVGEKKKAVSDSTHVIDGEGRFLIPGLWDMHVHYNWNALVSTRLLLANGITGVREMWGVMGIINNMRDLAARGEMLLPEIYSAGAIIDGPKPIWQGSAAVGSPEEGKDVVRQQVKGGVDFIKVYNLLSKDTYKAIAEEANVQGIPFAGHVPDEVTLYEAIALGQQSVEHMIQVLDMCTNDPDRLKELTDSTSRYDPSRIRYLVNSFNEERFDSLANVLAESNTWMCPTLTVLRAIGRLNDSLFMRDDRLKYLPDFMTRSWNPREDFRFSLAGEEYYRAMRETYELHIGLVGKLHDAGVKLLAGTDFPNPYCYPGFSLHDELELMVEAGLSPLAALQTATLNPALFMGKEELFGTVAEGKVANLLLLRGNPLERIQYSREIESVILRGQILAKEELGEMLEKALEVANR